MPDREVLRPCFFTENLNETLELISVSVWAAVDATIHQHPNLVPQLIVALKSASLLDSEAQGQYMTGLK